MSAGSRAGIVSSQLEQLRSLVAELFPGNRFYSRKLNAAGITFDIASMEDFCERFPFTTKVELAADQRTIAPFGSNLTYPLERYTRLHQTSGTGGDPLRWLDTAESWDWMVENWSEILRHAGAEAADRVYFAFSFGPFIGFWLAFEAAARLGCLCVPGGGLSTAARLRAIVDNGITILCCTPTYAARLAEVALEEKIDLSRGRVRTVIVAGEPGGSIPATRATLAGLWPGAEIFDHHGMTEVGPVTYGCRARPGVLHILEESYVAEIVDPLKGTAVPAGKNGELVLTPLGRTGSPLLRYRTGDLVRQQTDRCACGSEELALEGGILGRTDDMIIIRGVNIHPSAVEEIIRSCGEVGEYRVEVSNAKTLAEISLQIEARPQCRDATSLVRTLEKRFEEGFALRVPVTLVPFGTLPRYEMKHKRWVVRS
jgi:phenylacetate-CoA ligase